MAIGKLFKSLLGGAGSNPHPAADPVDYQGFTIEPEPIDEDGKFRTAGYISGERDGETRRIRFIRADQSTSLEAAVDHSIAKARQIIDEQGKSLLDKSHL
jgi:hypothetical protein